MLRRAERPDESNGIILDQLDADFAVRDETRSAWMALCSTTVSRRRLCRNAEQAPPDQKFRCVSVRAASVGSCSVRG